MKVEFLKILVAFSGAIWLGALGLFAPISKSRTGFLRLQLTLLRPSLCVGGGSRMRRPRIWWKSWWKLAGANAKSQPWLMTLGFFQILLWSNRCSIHWKRILMRELSKVKSITQRFQYGEVWAHPWSWLRLEFTNGGWCMHDEAAPHYMATCPRLGGKMHRERQEKFHKLTNIYPGRWGGSYQHM